MVFEYFLRFIRDLLLRENQTIAHAALSQVIGMILLRPPDGHLITKTESKEVTQFILNLIK